jgi:Sec-independent protein translocase protein TatA
MPDLTGVAILVVAGVVILLFGGPKFVDWAKHIGRARKAYADELAGTAASPTSTTPRP